MLDYEEYEEVEEETETSTDGEATEEVVEPQP